MQGEGWWSMFDPALATLMVSRRLGCSGGAPVMEGSAVDHQTPQPPLQPPFPLLSGCLRRLGLQGGS